MDNGEQEQAHSDLGSEHAEDNHEEAPEEQNNGEADQQPPVPEDDTDRPVVELFVKVNRPSEHLISPK